METIGSCGMPSAFDCRRPIGTKAVEQTISAARPRLAICTLSWTLHDVHEPQSPDPAITSSHCSASSAMTASVAGTVATGLRRLITDFTP